MSFPLFVWGLFSSVALFSPVALFGSAVFSAGSPVDLEANLPLTDDDIQLRTWILDLFKTVKPNHEYRMFLWLSL